MSSDPRNADLPDPDRGPRGVPPGVDGQPAVLAELVAVMRRMDRLAHRATVLARRVDGRRAVAEEGVPVDTALQLHAAWTRQDVNLLQTAADVLDRMPAAEALFDAGTFTWGHVRTLAGRTGRLDRATTDRIDAHLDDHAARLAQMEPEQRLWAIDDICDHATPAELLERRERDQERGDVLVLQPRLDGTGTGWFDLAPEAFTTVASALTAEADTPRAPACATDEDGGRLPAGVRDPETPRSRQLADALVRICGRGSPGGPSRPARVTVTVDVDRVTDTFAGTLRPTLATRPPRILRRTLDRIGCDADLDVVLTRGTDLLAAKRYQPTVPEPVRRAVAARDDGCRFPTCRAPVSWCDVHHVIEQTRQLDHHMTNLILLCRRHHSLVHRGGWQQTLRPDGSYTVRRRGRTWTTLPRQGSSLPPPERTAPDAPAHDPPRTPRTGHGRQGSGDDRTDRAGPPDPDVPF